MIGQDIPDNLYVSLATLANSDLGHPETLAHRAEELGIAVERRGRGWGYIRMGDLDRLIGPAKASSFRRTNEPDWLPTARVSGLVGIDPGEIIAVAERRGVAVRRSFGTPMISRSAGITLGRILDTERSYPVADTDWVRAEVALPRLRQAQTTLLSGGVMGDFEAIDLTDPNEPRFHSETLREIAWRCRLVGIRYRRPRLDRHRRGPLAVCGYDLYRLLNIEGLPGQDLDAYRAASSAAYESVIGKPLPSESSTSAA